MFKKSKITRFISLSAAAVCMASAMSFAPISILTADAADPLTAFEITEDMKIGWNIGNSMDATASGTTAGVESETAWGNPKTNQALIDEIKARGFNTVRIPTTWYQHLDADNNIDPAWMARVKEIVDYCFNNDMYVILNVHHENWINRADLGTAYNEMKPKLMKIWQQIATEFAEYDQHLIFECMNEPRAAGTTHEWWGPQQDEVDTINKLNADFVELIRSTKSPYSSTRLLMIPGYCASSDKTIFSKIEVPDDDYVAVSIHAYSPYTFVMAKDDGNGNLYDHSTYTESYSAELHTILENIRNTFIDKDIPVVIGEFSASNYQNTEARCDWATDYISTTKKFGIPCVLWDNDARGNSDPSEAHDYIDRKAVVNNGATGDAAWYPDSVQVVDTMMKVLADDSIVWGSEGKAPVIKHQDISTGKKLLDKAVSLDAAIENGNCTPGLNATWDELENNEVAIKYTGDIPVVAVCDGNWKGWTEISPYDVDEVNGIAYYAGDRIKAAWSGDASEIQHIFARTNTKTEITDMVILGASEIEIPTEEVDKTIKFDLSFKDVSRTDNLVFSFKTTAGSTANGCVGFMNGADWEMVEWETVADSTGTVTVEIPMSKIPETVENGQAQIWWCDNEVSDFTYVFKGNQPESEPTSEPTSEPDVVPPTGIVYGDANEDGNVTISDCVTILQYLANGEKYKLSDHAKAQADVDGVAGVTGKDAAIIQLVDAGIYKASELPLKAQ
ncbi:MAG: cellulase family glycosylhydrolase [Ruminococcus sp.]|nr:cellulase family glycosylhydrolase [Ruminococcus sp.]